MALLFLFLPHPTLGHRLLHDLLRQVGGHFASERIQSSLAISFGIESKQPFRPRGAQQSCISADQYQIVPVGAQFGGFINCALQNDPVSTIDRIFFKQVLGGSDLICHRVQLLQLSPTIDFRAQRG